MKHSAIRPSVLMSGNTDKWKKPPWVFFSPHSLPPWSWKSLKTKLYCRLHYNSPCGSDMLMTPSSSGHTTTASSSGQRTTHFSHSSENIYEYIQFIVEMENKRIATLPQCSHMEKVSGQLKTHGTHEEATHQPISSYQLIPSTSTTPGCHKRLSTMVVPSDRHWTQITGTTDTKRYFTATVSSTNVFK